MRWWSIVLVSLTVGCSSAHTPVVEYPIIKPFKLISRPQSEVKRACDASRGEDGLPCHPRVKGFFDYRKREMWVAWDADIWTVFHEMCHAAGFDETTCRKKVRP